MCRASSAALWGSAMAESSASAKASASTVVVTTGREPLPIIQKPPPTGGALLRSGGNRAQAQRSAVEQYGRAHQLVPSRSSGKSLRSDRRSSSRARTRYTIVSRCSSALSSSIHDRMRPPGPSARCSGDLLPWAISASSGLARWSLLLAHSIQVALAHHRGSRYGGIDT